jgi:hypothetical protein
MRKVLALALFGFLAFPQESHAEGASTGWLHEAALQEAVRLGAMTRGASLAQAQPPQRSWASRHPVLMGALAGAGTGAGISALGCKLSGDTHGIVSCYVWVPIAAGVGGGVGAVIGLMRSR